MTKKLRTTCLFRCSTTKASLQQKALQPQELQEKELVVDLDHSMPTASETQAGHCISKKSEALIEVLQRSLSLSSAVPTTNEVNTEKVQHENSSYLPFYEEEAKDKERAPAMQAADTEDSNQVVPDSNLKKQQEGKSVEMMLSHEETQITPNKLACITIDAARAPISNIPPAMKEKSIIDEMIELMMEHGDKAQNKKEKEKMPRVDDQGHEKMFGFEILSTFSV